MNPDDKAEAIQRYEERLKEFGPSMKALGWRDEEQQKLRFKILAEIGDLNGKKILDVGCGFGDFYGYLKEQGINADFTGYDVTPKFIEVAREKYPDARFEVKDILADSVDETFDYVFSSGVFNHKIADNMTFTKAMITKMCTLSKIGVATNMMTDKVDYQDAHLFYYSPKEMEIFARGLGSTTLRENYGLYEFSLYIKRA
jgi:trans-aconitate methyltransferase